ncbi:pre-mRNA-splicing factor syf1 [Ascosphaera pollenicola]|nr:pre-mRNA-splicing factor syf1 [Ascosphaera pollenicola]
MFVEGSLKHRGECLTSVETTDPIWENVISRLNPWARARREDVEGFDQPAGNTRHETRVQASSPEMIWAFLKARRRKRKVPLENDIDAFGSSEGSADVFDPMGGARARVALLHQLEDDGQNISPSKESLTESFCESDLTDNEDEHLKKKARLEQDWEAEANSKSK